MKKIIIFLGVLIILLVTSWFIKNDKQQKISLDVDNENSINKIRISNKKKTYYSRPLFDQYGSVVHSISDGDWIQYSTTTSLENPFSSCLYSFQSTRSEILEITEPGSDWVDFKEKGYNYSFKYPKNWKITHIDNYGKNTKVFSEIAAIIIQETNDYTQDYEATSIICDQFSYYYIPIPLSDFGYVARKKEAEQPEMSHVKEYELCTILQNKYGCSGGFRINNKHYYVTYVMEHEGPFDEEAVQILDKIITTFKPLNSK